MRIVMFISRKLNPIAQTITFDIDLTNKPVFDAVKWINEVGRVMGYKPDDFTYEVEI
jgi:hypothetical protein